MQGRAGHEIHITTVVVRRPPGAAPLNPEHVQRKVLASLNHPLPYTSWLYLCLSAACLAGAVWAVYRAVHPL